MEFLLWKLGTLRPGTWGRGRGLICAPNLGSKAQDLATQTQSGEARRSWGIEGRERVGNNEGRAFVLHLRCPELLVEEKASSCLKDDICVCVEYHQLGVISARVPPGNRWHIRIGKWEGSLIKELFTKLWEGIREPYGSAHCGLTEAGEEGAALLDLKGERREGRGEGMAAAPWRQRSLWDWSSLCCLRSPPFSCLLPVPCPSPPTTHTLGQTEGRSPWMQPRHRAGSGERVEGQIESVQHRRKSPSPPLHPSAHSPASPAQGTNVALINGCSLSATHYSRPFKDSNSFNTYIC